MTRPVNILKLTDKQLEAVKTCLAEWASVEQQTVTGGKLAAYYLRTLASIIKQTGGDADG